MPQVVDGRWRGARFWLRMFGLSAIATVLIVVVFADATPRHWAGHWRSVATSVATSFLFAFCIGPMLGVAVPRLAPAIWCRMPAPLNWVALVAVMGVCALAGSAVAVTILTVVGYGPTARWLDFYIGSMRISVVMTLAIGIVVTAYEMNRARLAQANTQARLASLESRVQPHFLFNTLNSIAALTHNDPAGAERMTTELAAILRSSLDSHETPLVTLGDELALVRNYLSIEHVRFGDRLHFSIDTDGAPMDARVPRMSIQTLVENSVKYAVSPRREGATIGVYASAANGRLRVEVHDDGPGFDTGAVPAGHGLSLLRDRLELLFNRRARLTLDGRPGATSVAIDLPHEPIR